MKLLVEFTRKEKLGIAVLGVSIVAMAARLEFRDDTHASYQLSADTTKVEYIQPEQIIDSVQVQPAITKQEPKEVKIKYFEFDPNVINEKGWMDLGFSKKQANSILNYRESYGPFNQKEDLKEVFVISEKKYNELEPYIVIGNTGDYLIDINVCSSTDLQVIRGVGPVYAERIIKRRDELGGFHTPSQLNEVYGLDAELIEIISKRILFDETHLRKIPINYISKDDLKKHPYFNFEMVAMIVKKRETTVIRNLDFLVEEGLLKEEDKLNIEPYIVF